MKAWLTDLVHWVYAVIAEWYFWLPSSALAAAINYMGQLRGWTIGRLVWVAVLSSGVVLSMFRAWRKEYVQNRTGPKIMLEWLSKGGHRRLRTHDMVRLTNCGHAIAININVGAFSSAQVTWHEPIEVQSLAPGRHIEQWAQFGVQKPGIREIGYMSIFLLEYELRNDAPPFSVEVSFSDVNQTIFSQTFYLCRGNATESEVTVTLGPPTTKRP